MEQDSHYDSEIAIVGMNCRFPGSKNVDEFWHNLCRGVESIRRVSRNEAEKVLEHMDYVSHPQMQRTFRDPNYVDAGSLLDDVEMFDASFFGLNPGEVELMDPQQRLFLECAWGAMENAGYTTENYQGLVGVYGGSGLSKYLMQNLYANAELMYSERDFMIGTGNENDYLATRVSYKLDLRGPSFTIQSACSTSLVATHLACQSLLGGECDMAMAGGVIVIIPHCPGYLYRPGGIYSPEGRCYTFDERANGTIFAHSGVGIVVLKRLSEAIEDRDEIYAIIKGSAINNDGAVKAGYGAPSISGQVAVVEEALAVADVDPGTIGYVEAHGTGTSLGDPIEINALKQIFESKTDKKNYCAIGSVKTNIGHAAVAAGVAGLIKTALALKHNQIPPSLNFEKPNPRIDFTDSPFFVNTELSPWKDNGAPHRAGVSAFGVGGTNAHVILEQPPKIESNNKAKKEQLLVFSAKSQKALDDICTNFAQYLKSKEVNLADAAFTLALGRARFNCRRFIVCENNTSAIDVLADTENLPTIVQDAKERPVVFMFSGQGAQYVNMSRDLYCSEPYFRQIVDQCAELLEPHLNYDLRHVLYPEPDKEQEATDKIVQTSCTQPALFTVEYATAKLFIHWGIEPKAMIGHSIGEYAAACLAGCLELKDALALVAARGRLMQSMEPGIMMAVPMEARELLEQLPDGVSLAAHNAPGRCVVAGSQQVIEEMKEAFAEKKVRCQILKTSHAFHSSMMEPMLGDFLQEVKKIEFQTPKIPFVSNVSGDWISDDEVQDPGYWIKHVRQAVRFSEGIRLLHENPQRILLEVGPGHTLTTLSKRHGGKDKPAVTVFSSIRHIQDKKNDLTVMLSTLGQLWAAGAAVDWEKFYDGEQRKRTSLPTYPFERKRYWIDPVRHVPHGGTFPSFGKKKWMRDWFYTPSWKRSFISTPERKPDKETSTWLFFADNCGVTENLAQKLSERGDSVLVVNHGAENFSEEGEGQYKIDAGNAEHYKILFEKIAMPDHIVYLWSIGDNSSDKEVELSFYSLLWLAQALGEQELKKRIPLTIVSSFAHRVTGSENLIPERATLLGPCRTIPHEYPHIICRNIDIQSPALDYTQRLLQELDYGACDQIIAYRGHYRWVQDFELTQLHRSGKIERLREGGVYVITGGLGGVGLAIAEYLAKSVRAKLVMINRSALPEREKWSQILEQAEDPAIVKIQQVQMLERLGSEVLPLSADVTDANDLYTALKIAQEKFGAIHGIIHAAGIAGGGLIQLKEREAAAKVLRPKIEGSKALIASLHKLGQEKFDFVLLTSSIFSIIGGMGQVDYCAGNAFLDCFADQYATQSGNYCVSIGWDGWQQVGMTADSEVMSAGQKQQAESKVDFIHPLLHKCESQEDGISYRTKLKVEEQWILTDHKIMGMSVVPATAYLEMVCSAQYQQDKQPVELRDVFFLAPFIVPENESREVVLSIDKENRFSIVGNGEQKLAMGEIAKCQSTAPQKDLAQLAEECTLSTIDIAARESNAGNEALQFGPRWKNLKKVQVGDFKGLAELELAADFAEDLEQYNLHPALMDMATGPLFGYISSIQPGMSENTDQLESTFLPLSYKSLKIFSSLPAKIYNYIECDKKQFEQGEPEVVSYDITILDEKGNVLAAVESFSLKKIEGAPESQPMQTLEQAVDLQVEAIVKEEGVETFCRVLAADVLPHIVVSGRDLNMLRKPPEDPSQSSLLEAVENMESKTILPRPDIGTPYLAPRNQTEEKLVEVWQQVLGVDQVGVKDNFFDLGGDSILGVQIIAKSKNLGLQLAPSQLFQYHTIAELAQVLSGETATAEQKETTPQSESFSEAGLDEKELGDFLDQIGDE